MSEWSAPGGPSAEREPPRYGELAPEGWTPPPQDPRNPHGPQAWTPPPKPGLLPLRPLTLGEILAAAFQVIRRNPGPTFGFALVISIVTTLAIGTVMTLFGVQLLSRIDMAAAGDRTAIEAGSVILFVLGALGSSLLSTALTGLIQGIVSLEVARGTLGERLRLRELWAGVRGRFWLLIGWSLLLGAATTVGIGIWAALLVLLASIGPLGLLLAIPAGLLGGLGILVLYCWIGTRLAFVPALLVVERRRLGEAIRRSWTLTIGHWWRIFGITLLVGAVITVALEIVTIPVSLLGSLLGGVLNPNGSEDFTSGWFLGSLLASAVVSTVFTAIATVASAATPAILYLDVRMRREGLDLDLQRAAERPSGAAAGGAATDPFQAGPGG